MDKMEIKGWGIRRWRNSSQRKFSCICRSRLAGTFPPVSDGKRPTANIATTGEVITTQSDIALADRRRIKCAIEIESVVILELGTYNGNSFFVGKLEIINATISHIDIHGIIDNIRIIG